MSLFKRKAKDTEADKAMIEGMFFDNIQYTYTQEDGHNMTADITRDDIKQWLYAVTRSIQSAFAENKAIKNWLCGTMYFGGQELEFYVMKKGGESPLKLLKAEQEKVKILEEKLRNCTVSADPIN